MSSDDMVSEQEQAEQEGSAEFDEACAHETAAKTESPGVYLAISRVMGDVGRQGIEKAKQSQGFSYRSVDQVMNVLNPLMVKHGLLMLPEIVERTTVERKARSGGAIFWTNVRVRYDFIALSDGSKHSLCFEGEALDVGDKSVGKAASYALKTMCFEVFMIPVEGQDDPDAEVHEVAATAPPGLTDDEQRQVIDMIAAIDDEVDGFGVKWRETMVAKHGEADTDLGVALPQSAFKGVLGQLQRRLEKAQADAARAADEAAEAQTAPA